MPLVVKSSIDQSFYLPGSLFKCEFELHNSNPPSTATATASQEDDQHQQQQQSRGGLFSWLWGGGSKSDSPSKSSTDKQNSANNNEYDIECVYAQVYGICIGDATWLIPFADENKSDDHQSDEATATTGSSSLSSMVPKRSNASIIFATPPTIILPETKLVGSQSIRVAFSIVLPTDLPPSFIGNLLRYSYLACIAVKLRAPIVNPKNPAEQTQVLKIPFRILNPMCSLCKLEPPFVSKNYDYHWETQVLRSDTTGSVDGGDGSSSSDSSTDDNDEAAHARRATSRAAITTTAAKNLYYKEKQQRELDYKRKNIFEYVFASIDQVIASNSSPKHFEITSIDDDFSNGKKSSSSGPPLVCRFSLTRQAYRIGDSIMGIFDFSQSQIDCVKVKANLTLEEIVNVSLFKDQRNAASAQFHHNKRYQTVDEFSEYTLHTRTTNFQMMIPAHAPAQFQTDKVAVKWSLNFEFFILSPYERNKLLKYKHAMRQKQQSNKQPNVDQNSQTYVDDEVIMIRDLKDCKVEILRWTLPLHVFVPHQDMTSPALQQHLPAMGTGSSFYSSTAAAAVPSSTTALQLSTRRTLVVE